MNWKLTTALVGMAMLASAERGALADGELHIFNWGDYTNPEMIKKFEDAYKVKVTVTDYDSNDTALAKVRAGGHGFDIVVPSANFVQIWIKEGCCSRARPDQMENFKNVDRVGRRRLGSGPALHGSVAVGPDRHPRRHRDLQGRHQHLGDLPRPAGRAGGKINVRRK